MTPAERANRVRFRGQRGFYEVYFVEVQDRALETGLWLRYTLRSPTRASEDPIAEVWAMHFHRREPEKKLALKATVPFDLARIERERLLFSIAGCELTHAGCRGALERDGRRLSWDLAWEEGSTLLHFPYASMYRGPFPRTKLVSPNFDFRARGRYSVDSETRELDDVPGQQSHIWGTKHAHRWIWAHANTFREEPHAVFEGLTAQIKVGPVVIPALTMFALRYKGRDYVFNAPRDLVTRNESRTDSEPTSSAYFPVGTWIVGGGDDHLRFRGELWSDLSHYIGVRYTDPDGSGLVCCHSKVASCRLEVLASDAGTWRVVDTLTSEGGAALEFAGRAPDPRIPILV